MTDEERILEAINVLSSKVEVLSGSVSLLTGALDTHTRVQDEKCSHALGEICSLKNSVYGSNGDEGLKTGFTRLSAQAKVVFGLLAAIGTASVGSLVAWIVSIISTGAAK